MGQVETPPRTSKFKWSSTPWPYGNQGLLGRDCRKEGIQECWRKEEAYIFSSILIPKFWSHVLRITFLWGCFRSFTRWWSPFYIFCLHNSSIMMLYLQSSLRRCPPLLTGYHKFPHLYTKIYPRSSHVYINASHFKLPYYTYLARSSDFMLVVGIYLYTLHVFTYNIVCSKTDSTSVAF